MAKKTEKQAEKKAEKADKAGKPGKKLRCGVIGLGMGVGHIYGYQSHPSAEVVAICDVDKDRLAHWAKECKIPQTYTSYEEMLAKEKLDVLSVATPTKFHHPMTLAGLAAGCHVLCEKPVAMNAAQAKEMAAAAKKAGKRLMINFSYRFREQTWALKKQVETGILGDIYYGRAIWLRRRGMPGFGGWFSTKSLSGGGPLLDLGIHRMDMALWFMGYPKAVWVMAGTFDPIASELARKAGKKFDVEDMGVAMIRFENGAMLQVEASWASNIAERELMETRLFGTKAGLVQRNINEEYQYEAEIFVEQAGCQFDMKLHPPVPESRSGYQHFIDSIVAGTPHTATIEEGVKVMEILDAIYESARLREPVHIKN